MLVNNAEPLGSHLIALHPDADLTPVELPAYSARFSQRST